MKSFQDRPYKEHYQRRGGIQPIDFIKSNNMTFEEGNVVKYIYRYRFRNPHEAIEDLRDAITYINWLIEKQEGRAKDHDLVSALKEDMKTFGKVMPGDVPIGGGSGGTSQYYPNREED